MSEEYDLSRAFERIENYLIDSMMRNFKHHRAEELKEGYNWEQWQTKQLESLEEYRRNNREKFSAEFADLNDRVGDMLRATAADASYKQEQKILRAIQKGYAPRRSTAQSHAAFFRLNERKMNALIEATTNDLSRAEQAILRRSNDVYRKAIFDAQVFMNSGAATYEQAVDMAVKDMIGAGLQCVEYKNGARHTLPDYAEMAIRTANKRAYLRGEGLKMQEWGISTVIINRRHGACGRCADFVGMVFIDDVYAGGKPSDHGGKYPLLSDAMKAGLFHPRCKDSSSPYFEGISTPPDREVLPKKAQEELTEIERAEQKAAYGKRMEKMYRRLSKYALDPDNKKMYRGRAEQWSEYTEKWQSYHEKQLEKAEKSGIIKQKNYNSNFESEANTKTSTTNSDSNHQNRSVQPINLFNATNEEYEEWTAKYYELNKEVSFTREDNPNIYAYTGGSYEGVNAVLRGGESLEKAKRCYGEAFDESKYRKIADGISKELSKFKLHEPIELRRCVSKVDYITGATSSVEDMKTSIGKVYTEKGFSSTSVTGSAADAFGMGDNQTLLEIVAPTNTRGAFIYKISEHSPEFEFLIDKNTSFKILDAGEREIEVKNYKGVIVKKKQRFMRLQVI